MGTLQITDLSPALAKDQNELNLYVEKAQNFRQDLDKIEKVDEGNYDDAKKLRAEITSQKTSVENTRLTLKRPLLKLGEAIDARAKELSKPFEDMKAEIQEKIGEHEKAENERKEAEAKRVQGIIEKIQTFEILEDLEKFYKSLDQKDQRKKTVAEAGVLQKEKIAEKIKQDQKNEIIKTIESLDTVEELEKIDLGEFKDDLGSMISNKVNKIKLDTLEAEKEKERIADRQRKESTDAYISKINAMTLEDLEGFVYQAGQYIDEEKVLSHVKTRKMELENEKLRADAKKRDEEDRARKEKEEKEKREAEEKAREKAMREKDEKIQKFLKKDRGEGHFYTKTLDDRVEVYKLVDTLDLTK